MPDRINLAVRESGPISLDAMDQHAYMATMLENPRKIDGISFDGTADVLRYVVCTTAAGTATKTVSIDGFSLVTGAMVNVMFNVTNTAATPKLNVSSTGAKQIRYRKAALAIPSLLSSGSILTLVYDGTYWEITGYIYDDSETVSESDIVVLSDEQIDALF